MQWGNASGKRVQPIPTDTQANSATRFGRETSVTFGNTAFESKGIDAYVTPHADANLTRTD